MENEKIGEVVSKWLKTDCNGHKEKKNGFDYLSWVYGWEMALREDPKADFNPVLDANGNDYWSDGRTARVYVDVTIHGVTKRMSLAVMDFKNNAIPVEKITSCDVNKAIQRCTVKCLAKFGLGLYIYAGEDLPIGESSDGNNRIVESSNRRIAEASTSSRTVARVDASAAPKKPDGGGKLFKEAWEDYLTLESVKSLDANGQKKMFCAMLQSVVGKNDPHLLTSEQWGRVIAHVDALKVV